MGLKDVPAALLGLPVRQPEPSKPAEIVRPTEIIFEWQAPERFFKPHSREFYRRLAVILTCIAFIFLFILDFLVVAVLGIVFFAIYAFHTVPPRIVTHRITNNGIDYATDFKFKWEELSSFFFEDRGEYKVLFINTVANLPGRLTMILDEKIDRSALSSELNRHISIIEEPEKNIYDEILRRFSSRIKIHD